MGGAPCKAALCTGCLESISDVKVKEFFNIIVHLVAAGGHFDDDQLDHIIDAGEDLQKLIGKHQEKEKDIVRKLQKQIPDLALPPID